MVNNLLASTVLKTKKQNLKFIIKDTCQSMMIRPAVLAWLKKDTSHTGSALQA